MYPSECSCAVSTVLSTDGSFLGQRILTPVRASASVFGQSRTRKLRNSRRKRHDAHLLGSRLTSSLPQYCGGIAATSRSCESGFSFRSISQQVRARGLVEKYLLEALESGDKGASAEEVAQARQRIAEGKTAAQKSVACSINNSTKRARISDG